MTGGYTFDDADMSTINGIGGTLTSTGKFEGHLERIRVAGVTSAPDFHLEMTKQPVRLEHDVPRHGGRHERRHLSGEGGRRLGESKIHATGSVVGAPKVKGRSVLLDVHIEDGRLEDVLRLAVKGNARRCRRRLALRSAFELPPGEAGRARAAAAQGHVHHQTRAVHERHSAGQDRQPEPPRARRTHQHQRAERDVLVRRRVFARRRRAAAAAVSVRRPGLHGGPERHVRGSKARR